MEHRRRIEFLSPLGLQAKPAVGVRCARMLPLLVLTLVLQAEPEVAPSPEPVSTVRRPAGLGLVILLSGAIFGGVGVAMRFSAQDIYRRIDTGDPGFSSYAELQASRGSGELQQQLAYVFITAGALAIVTGAILTVVLGGPSTFAAFAPTGDGGAAFTLRGTLP